MKINIITRKITPTDDVREYIEKKLAKLDKFFADEPAARIVAGTLRGKEYIEVTISAGGMMYRAEVTDSDLKACADEAADIIERQIRKNKTRLAKKIKRDSLADTTMLSGADYTDGEDTGEFKIVKTKRFELKPMTPPEAVLQMQLLGHSCFVFKNAETGEMNVVYHRRDGDFALIESV